MDNSSVIIEFDETSQQFHFSCHPIQPNTFGYKNLQTFTDPNKAFIIGQFLESIRELKMERMTFADMKVLSTEARFLLRNYNKSILGMLVIN